eukprot:17065-Pyramimonas_sp.AAC.1
MTLRLGNAGIARIAVANGVMHCSPKQWLSESRCVAGVYSSVIVMGVLDDWWTPRCTRSDGST